MPRTPTHNPNWGGTRPNAGRPPLDPEDRTHITSVRLTSKQHEKFMALGGATWLRAQLEKKK